MDRDVDVRTPESIAFSYQLAGLGSRFLAVVADLVIQILVLIAIFTGLTMAAARLPSDTAKHAATAASASGGPDFEKIATALVIALIVAIVFMIFFGYFILFEALWNGQTPGKKLLGIRVVRDGGYPVDFGASLVRNLIRIGEMSVFFYAPAAVSALLSPENKRLGDIAAGTIVVRDARLAVPDLRQLAHPNEPAYAATLYLTGDERALVKRFLERREALQPHRRLEIAANLAARIRPRVPAELQRLDDEALLERL